MTHKKMLLQTPSFILCLSQPASALLLLSLINTCKAYEIEKFVELNCLYCFIPLFSFLSLIRDVRFHHLVYLFLIVKLG